MEGWRKGRERGKSKIIEEKVVDEEEGKVRKFKMEGWMMGRGRKETRKRKGWMKK